MAKGYSKDLRVRAVSIVETGESAREAARLLNLGASTAIRWIERWTTTGSVDAKPGTGHSRSPLGQHRQRLLELVAAAPDTTLEEIRAVASREEAESRHWLDLALLRTTRHHLQKKLCTPPSRIVLMLRLRAPR